MLAITRDALICECTFECSEDSAFYVAHYIKWFDGEKLTFVIDEVREQIIAVFIKRRLFYANANFLDGSGKPKTQG